MSEPFGMSGHATPETTQEATPPLNLTEGASFGMEGHKMAIQEPVQTQTQSQPQTQTQNQPQQNASDPQNGGVQNASAEVSGSTGAENNTGEAANPGGLLANNVAEPENQPITDFSSVDLGIPQGSFDQSAVESFGKVATEIKLTPAQAKAIAQWQMEQITTAKANYDDAQQKALESAWGGNIKANCQQVNELCARISQAKGLENFASELANSGAADNAVVIQGLFHVAQMLAEDSTGKINGQGAVTETALDGLMEVYRSYQRN